MAGPVEGRLVARPHYPHLVQTGHGKMIWQILLSLPVLVQVFPGHWPHYAVGQGQGDTSNPVAKVYRASGESRIAVIFLLLLFPVFICH